MANAAPIDSRERAATTAPQREDAARTAPPAPWILVVNDDRGLSMHLRTVLNGCACRIDTVATPQEAIERAGRGPVPDLVFLDMDVPGVRGLEALERIRQSHSRLKVVLVASAVDPRKVIRAVRLGAHDCIPRSFGRATVATLLREYLTGAGEGEDLAQEDLGNGSVFVAASPAMRRLRSLVIEVARTEVPVLCIGESGTGKEVVARLLHARSKRRAHNFLKVNCAALPSELLESELFGYEQGAFTGAVRSKPGKFELCAKGTIFLDEIAEMPTQLQAKLLHVLQDGEFSRLGGRSRIQTDARVVAATNVDIRAALESRRLREDLYYRLNTVVIEIPPLRERREEVPVLLRHFLRRHGGRNGLPSRSLTAKVLEFACRHDWPGNVRELENFAKRYLVLGDRALAPNGPESQHAALAPPAHSEDLKSVARGVKRDAEIAAIRTALNRTNWNRKEAARLLDISYKTLLDKIRFYELGKRNGQQFTP